MAAFFISSATQLNKRPLAAWAEPQTYRTAGRGCRFDVRCRRIVAAAAAAGGSMFDVRCSMFDVCQKKTNKQTNKTI